MHFLGHTLKQNYILQSAIVYKSTVKQLIYKNIGSPLTSIAIVKL
jgi:hypothetical protein